MENQPTILDKALKISVTVGALIVALSIAYYLVIFLPHKATQALEQQKQEQQAKEHTAQVSKQALEKCLADVDIKMAEITKGKSAIGASETKFYMDFRTENIDKCFRTYPQN